MTGISPEIGLVQGTNNYSISVTQVVAVLGDCSERVSTVKFPDNRENTGNFAQDSSPLALNPLNSEFVWTNSLHIEQGIFGRKQRSLLLELRKLYCESADVA
jgi:hypothetical protein